MRFFGYALIAGGIWKGDIMVADIEELEILDASEIHAQRLNAKGVFMPTLVKITYSRSQMAPLSCLEEIMDPIFNFKCGINP